MTLRCSSVNCPEDAVETLELRGQVGHIHDCAAHAAAVREWCDVTRSAPITDGRCSTPGCTGNVPIGIGMPTPLGKP